jgi:hypothetical protein
VGRIVRHPPEQVRRILERNARLGGVVFARREPTMNPDLVQFIDWARELGYREISLVTNGRLLARDSLLERLVEAGLTSVGISVHGPDARTHDFITRRRGAFAQTVAGIRAVTRLRERGVSVGLKLHTTVCALNVDRLPELVRFALDFLPDSYGMNALFMVGEAVELADQVSLPYARMVAGVLRCLGPGGHLPISLCDAPPCATIGRIPQEYLGAREESHMVDLDAQGGARDARARRAKRGFSHRRACRACGWRNRCDGISRAYLERFGWAGLEPLPEPQALAFAAPDEIIGLLEASDGEWGCTLLEWDLEHALVEVVACRGPARRLEVLLSPRDDAAAAFARTARFNFGLRGRGYCESEISLARRVFECLEGRDAPTGAHPG